MAFLLAGACAVDDRPVTVAPAAIPVDQALITDFSDAVEGPDVHGRPGILYGDGPVHLGGSSSMFAAPGLSLPTLSIEPRGDGRALRVLARPGTPINDGSFYFGFALAFGDDQAVRIDATGYRGVRFTLEGDTGTCIVMFQVIFSAVDRADPSYPGVATCLLREDCAPPYSHPLSLEGNGVFEIPFDALDDGNPVRRVDVTTITAVGWKLYAPLSGPSCEVSLLLDDVAFLR